MYFSPRHTCISLHFRHTRNVAYLPSFSSQYLSSIEEMSPFCLPTVDLCLTRHFTFFKAPWSTVLIRIQHSITHDIQSTFIFSCWLCCGSQTEHLQMPKVCLTVHQTNACSFRNVLLYYIALHLSACRLTLKWLIQPELCGQLMRFCTKNKQDLFPSFSSALFELKCDTRGTDGSRDFFLYTVVYALCGFCCKWERAHGNVQLLESLRWIGSSPAASLSLLRYSPTCTFSLFRYRHKWQDKLGQHKLRL